MVVGGTWKKKVAYIIIVHSQSVFFS